MADFPIGVTLPGGVMIVDHLYGELERGVFRARRAEDSFLVTTVGSLRDDADLSHLPTNSGTPLVGVFDLESGGETAKALVEVEPAGRPTTEVAPLSPDAAVALAIDVADVVEAFNSELASSSGGAQQQSGGLHPAMVYVDDAGRLTGLALRWGQFFGAASVPCYGFTRPFSDFMAPEVAAGATSNAVDSALLSQCLAYWLTGESAYEGDDTIGRLHAIISDSRRDLQLGSGISEVVAAGLSPSPTTRPSLSELAALLRGDASGEQDRDDARAIPASEFRDLVFYSSEDEYVEPTPATPCLVLEDFPVEKIAEVALQPDYAPSLTSLSSAEVSALVTAELQRLRGAGAPLQVVDPFAQIERWLAAQSGSWISFQLEPKSLSGTGTARQKLL